MIGALFGEIFDGLDNVEESYSVLESTRAALTAVTESAGGNSMSPSPMAGPSRPPKEHNDGDDGDKDDKKHEEPNLSQPEEGLLNGNL